MNILIPVIIITAMGLIAGIGLTIASRFMAVEVDETVSDVNGVLPGANCGACGYAGCIDYANAVVNDNGVKANLCTVGGTEVAMQVSEILGIGFEAVEGKYAIVKCKGTFSKTKYVMEFRDLQTCSANKIFYRGRSSCPNACLGYGDCITACDYGAISMYHGVAKIDKSKCVGCGLCSRQCPNHLIDLIPSKSMTYVGCNNHDNGTVTRSICDAGCIGCGKCVRACKFDAIEMDNNLAVIDPEKCVNCGLCIKECPVEVIDSTKVAQKISAGAN